MTVAQVLTGMAWGSSDSCMLLPGLVTRLGSIPLRNWIFLLISIPLPEFHFRNSTSGIPLPEFHFRNSTSGIPLPEFHFRNTNSGIPLPEFHFRNSDSEIPITEFQFRNSIYGIGIGIEFALKPSLSGNRIAIILIVIEVGIAFRGIEI